MNPTTPVEERLPDLYRELMNEVRWRRDQEARFLTLFVAGFTILVGGTLAYIGSPKGDEHKLSVLTFAAVALILLLVATIMKIRREHAHYNIVAQEVVWLWDHWGFIAPVEKNPSHPLSASARNFGTGDGWGSSVFFLVLPSLSFLGLILWFLYLALK